ncbi:MAG: winged helix DNA-binding domain-containing protein [Chloroflexi bacterium]|nr:winged helix DNA-binding domain-containing protein [Chloroflexota bacterium]
MPARAVGIDSTTVLRHRARVSHLDRKLPVGRPDSLPAAAWGGLQDSVPRSGVISLHARVDGVRPDAWEDPSLVQIWFRGGADFLVPRADVGIFTLGSYPRDPARAQALEAIADEVHRLTGGRMTPVRELPRDLGGRPFAIRQTAITGRVHIRWDSANIWVIPVQRPSIDVEDARRELARRFLHWHGPSTAQRLARWAGVEPRDAAATWRTIEGELAPVQVDGVAESRFMLAADLDDLRGARPIEGVRLLPMDDPFTKHDHELLLADDTLRARALPKVGRSPGYIPGAVLVDGEIVGAWQRQQRKVTVHPFRSMPGRVRDDIEAEALAFPIAGRAAASVAWKPVAG